jgi:hypothetical protein
MFVSYSVLTCHKTWKITSIQNFVLMFLVDHNKHIIKNKHEQVQTMIEIMKIEHTNNQLGGTEHNNTASGLRF